MGANTKEYGKGNEYDADSVRPELDLHYIWNASSRMCGGTVRNVAAYIRVSTDLADQENSYETQERYFYRTITENPAWNLVGVYSDYGISGTSSEKRTGFTRLIRHCREGKIDRILCKSISRFARNAADFALTLHLLHESHVTVFFEKENLDTADPQNEFILNILGAFAQEESRSISCNMIMGNRMRSRRGDVRNVEMYGYRFNGKKVICKSGYQYKEVEAVEEEAAVIRRIFEETAKRKSYAQIARELNGDRIPAPDSPYGRMRRANPRKGQLCSSLEEGWTGESVSRIVHSERYAGDVHVQKSYTVSYLTHQMRKNKGEMPRYCITDHHAAIIDKRLYEHVKNVLESRPKCGSRRENREYPFSGKLICRECGRFYHIRNYRNKKTWFCPTAKRRNGMDTCRAESMEEYQIALLVRRAVKKEAEGMESRRFLEQMMQRLEKIQNDDGVEETRSIYKSRLAALESGKRDGDEAKSRKKQSLQTEFDCLERYWEELERDFGHRADALQWMKTLPDGTYGMAAFLDGVSGKYFKAFVLELVIGARTCTIRWFDGSVTELLKEPLKEYAYGC